MFLLLFFYWIGVAIFCCLICCVFRRAVSAAFAHCLLLLFCFVVCRYITWCCAFLLCCFSFCCCFFCLIHNVVFDDVLQVHFSPFCFCRSCSLFVVDSLFCLRLGMAHAMPWWCAFLVCGYIFCCCFFPYFIMSYLILFYWCVFRCVCSVCFGFFCHRHACSRLRVLCTHPWTPSPWSSVPWFPSLRLYIRCETHCSWCCFCLSCVWLYMYLRAHSCPFVRSFHVPPRSYTLMYPFALIRAHHHPFVSLHASPHHTYNSGKFPRPHMTIHVHTRPSVSLLPSFLRPFVPLHPTRLIHTHPYICVTLLVLLSVHAITLYVVVCFCLFW